MNNKKEQLIEYLLKTKDWTKSADIADAINMSVRTVKNYVTELNSEYPGLIK